MGREHTPGANREAGVPVAPSLLEQPQELGSGSSRRLGKATPVAGGGGDVPTTTGRKERCSRSPSSPGFAVRFRRDASAGSRSGCSGWAQRVMEKSSHTCMCG